MVYRSGRTTRQPTSGTAEGAGFEPAKDLRPLRFSRPNCDGDWEHSYGVEILTLDNPGWSLEIHVEDTPLAGTPFEPVKIERSDSDWLTCWVGVPDRPNCGRVQAQAFQAYCGPANLEEAIGMFLDWSRDLAADR